MKSYIDTRIEIEYEGGDKSISIIGSISFSIHIFVLTFKYPFVVWLANLLLEHSNYAIILVL